jgi:hypothetical protein
MNEIPKSRLWLCQVFKNSPSLTRRAIAGATSKPKTLGQKLKPKNNNKCSRASIGDLLHEIQR